MKVHELILIGGGVVGLTTAVAAAKRGLRVRVLDAAMGPALQTSFANAGQFSYGYSGPWATPGIVRELPRMLMDPNSPLRIRPDFSSISESLYQVRWLRWMAMNTKNSRFERNKRRIIELSNYSRRTRELFGVATDKFDHRAGGTLQLFRTIKKFEATLAADEPVLRRAGVDFSVVDVAGCIEQEPGLAAVSDEIAGGIIFHADETGDCYKLCQALHEMARKLGVDFLWNTRVSALKADGYSVRGVSTNRGEFAASTIVLAAGPWTRRLAAPLGLKVPIYPVRGYSLTAPIANEASAPVSTVLDQDTKIAITRFEDRIRVGGTAEVGGFSRPEDLRRRTMLVDLVTRVFPGAIATDPGAPIVHWAGFRPMTPDGTPVVGATACPGLYINAGHGTLGLTQSFGSAEFLADVLTGVQPQLDPRDFELARYGRWVRTSLYFPFVSPLPRTFPAIDRMADNASWR